jgi:exonuclease SbcC
MKILTLKIDNFISIKHAELDFNKFKNGVFLITGATGSGKSTILDAIHWALYGVTLNQQRAVSGVSKTIYSDYAAGKDELKVELVFIQSGIEYKIIRTMKKEGNTTLKFYTPDEIIDKIRDGNAAIEKVVGLNSKQFDHVVMLEQGNFSKFLLADSKDRAVLLRNIFDTQIFQRLEQRLKERVDSLKNEIDNSLQLEQTYLHGDTIDTIKSRITMTETGKVENETILKQYQTELQQYQDLQPKLQQYNMQMHLYTTAQTQLKQLEQQRQHIDDIAHKKALYAQYADSIKLYDKSVAVKTAIDNAEAEITKLQQQIWDASCKAVLANEVETAKKQVDELNRQFKGAYDYEEAEQKLGYLAIDYNKIKDQITDTEKAIADIQATGDDLNSQLPIREQYERALADYNKVKQQIAVKQTKLNTLNAQLEKAKPDYVESLKMHLLQICEKGTCPICGTAYLTDTNIKAPEVSFDKFQQMQAEKYALDQCIAEHAELTEPICDVEMSASVIRSELTKLSKQLTDYNKQLTDLQVKKQLSEASAERLKAQMTELQEFKDADSKALAIELETAETEYNNIKTAYDKYKQSEQTIAELRSKIESWKHTVELRKAEAAQDNIPLDPTTVSDGIEYRDTVLDYERNQAKYVAETERFNAEYTRFSAVTAPEKIADITEMECRAKISSINNSITELVKAIASADSNIENDNRIIKAVAEIRNHRAELMPKHKECKYVYDQLSGKNNAKLSLENFILHRQLEWILDTSNRYLSSLSNNQFALNIRWESIGRAQGGLEISILDKLSGKERPAQTFSGGELFQLSLSLSLGLMSSINSLFGGLDIDMLYVDEGMGTLDNESLNRVLSTLTGLKNISTVGIITHVQEVIDTIPQGFIVDKGLTGTTIKQFGV